MTIPTNLIENALNLTGQNYKDFSFFYFTPDFLEVGFCFYLLSPEFIKAYPSEHYRGPFGQLITEYQSGNPDPLISLLEKIPGKTTQI